MITVEQMNGVQETLDILHSLNASGECGEVLPPRIADHAEFGTVVYVGAAVPDDSALAECECDRTHVGYTVIRPDGKGSPLMFSGTLEESLIGEAILGLAPYDDAREATPNDWPNA